MKRLWIVGLFLMLIVMIATPLRALGRRQEFAARVYYIPFHVQTYKPVTPQTIEQVAHQKLVLHEESDALRQLITALDYKAVPGQLDEQMVRLKVVWRFQTYLVDADGGARDKESNYQVNANEIEGLVKALISSETSKANAAIPPTKEM